MAMMISRFGRSDVGMEMRGLCWQKGFAKDAIGFRIRLRPMSIGAAPEWWTSGDRACHGVVEAPILTITKNTYRSFWGTSRLRRLRPSDGRGRISSDHEFPVTGLACSRS